MCPAQFYVDQHYDNLVINEIHYNPKDSIYFNAAINAMDTVEGKNFEFVEVKNTGSTAINLMRTAFTKGINMEINSPMSIPPSGFAVFAEDAYWFEQKYGFSPDGEYEGKLSNSGEKINFKTPSAYFIDTVRYDTGGSWTSIPEQGLYSLALIDSDSDNSTGENWSIQTIHSTPRAENVFSTAADASLVINEIHYNPTEGQDAEFIELVNVTEQAINLQGITFTDGIIYSFNLPISLAPANEYPDNYLVLAKDFASFQSTYGFAPFDVFTGSLNNAGELIILQSPDGTILDQVPFGDALPWDPVPDNGLHSLALLELTENNLFGHSWSHNEDYYVTPGSENFPRCPEDFTGDGVINVSDFLDLNTNFGLSCDGCKYDLTGDGLVNVSDFLAFNSAYGLTCPTQVQNPLLQAMLSPDLENDLHMLDEKIIHPQLRKALSEMRNDLELIVYPNPSDGQTLSLMVLDFGEFMGQTYSVTVMDLQGKKLFQKTYLVRHSSI